MTEAKEAQFAVNALQAMHKPTGAIIRFATNRDDDFDLAERGRIGEVLENGEVYDENDVVTVAVKLLMGMVMKRKD